MIRLRYHLLAILICFALAAWGQTNTLLFNSSQQQLAGAAYAPASFGEEDRTFWFNFPSFHVGGGADFITRGQLLEILDGGEIPTSLVDEIIDGLGARNNLYGGAETTPLALGFKIKAKEKELFSVNLSWTERQAVSMEFGPNLLRLLWNGNKQFAGQQVDLGPIQAHGIYYREFALGGSAPVFTNKDLSLRAGFRAKYNIGIVSVDGAALAADFFTASDGSLIDFDIQGEANTAGFNEFDVLGGTGSGFGFDLGIASTFKQKFRVDVSILDIGSIKYDSDIETFQISASNEFQGLIVDNLLSQVEGVKTDSLENYFSTSSTEGGTFISALNTRLAVRVGYFVSAESKNNIEYQKHSIYLGYIQEFRDAAGATRKPKITGTYVYNAGSIIELGASLGVSGSDLDMGAFMSVRGGPFRFGLGSGDFSGLIMNSQKVSADLSFQLGFAF
ncbi:MAG: hypothetical protein ACI959_000024 [Limisphaerales bacterium]|jgi:hypothetical protein